MLPGFRFLFTAVVLSMSILVFGLGAAALLRTAHEEFASLPTRRATPEPMFPRQNNNLIPTLALLRVDPPVADKPVDNALGAVAPEMAPVEQAADASPPEPEKLAALKPEEPAPAEAAKPEIPATEAMAAVPAAPAEAETPVANVDMKLAAVADVPEPPASTTAAPAADAPSTESSTAATRIATLGGPAVIVDEKAAAKANDAKPDQSAAKKRAAQRARERRRMARRARLAREAAALALQQQLANNPFAQIPLARATR